MQSFWGGSELDWLEDETGEGLSSVAEESESRPSGWLQSIFPVCWQPLELLNKGYGDQIHILKGHFGCWMENKMLG